MKLIQHSIKKYFSHLEAGWKDYTITHDPELLHQIRRDIKKIRTLAKCMDYCDKGFSRKKALRTCRKIYQFSQPIREQAVLLQLCKRYKIKDHPASVISKKQWKEYRIIFEEWAYSIKTDHKLMERAGMSVTHQAFDRYCHKCIRRLKKAVRKKIDSKELHSVRKLMVEGVTLLSIAKEDNHLLPQLKEIEQLIGAWHDRFQLLQWLTREHPLRKVLILKLRRENRSDIRMIKLKMTRLFI